MAYKVVIAGGRSYDNLKYLVKVADKALAKKGKRVEIVSGTAGGADRLGEAYAYSRGFAVKRFPADWDTMKEYADAVMLFAPSQETLDIFKNYEKPVKIYK